MAREFHTEDAIDHIPLPRIRFVESNYHDDEAGGVGVGSPVEAAAHAGRTGLSSPTPPTRAPGAYPPAPAVGDDRSVSAAGSPAARGGRISPVGPASPAGAYPPELATGHDAEHDGVYGPPFQQPPRPAHRAHTQRFGAHPEPPPTAAAAGLQSASASPRRPARLNPTMTGLLASQSGGPGYDSTASPTTPLPGDAGGLEGGGVQQQQQHRAALDALRVQIRGLEEELQRREAQEAKVAGVLEVCEEALRSSKEKNEVLGEEHKRILELLCEKQDELGIVHKELHDAREAVRAMEADRAHAADSYRDSTDVIHNLTRQLQRAEALLAERHDNELALQAQLTQLELEREAWAGAEPPDTEQRVHRVRENAAEVLERHTVRAAYARHFDAWRRWTLRRGVEARLQDAADIMEQQLRGDLDAAHQRIEELSALCQSHETAVGVLREDIARREDVEARLEADVARLTEAVADAEAQLAETVEDRDRLAEEVRTLQEQEQPAMIGLSEAPSTLSAHPMRVDAMQRDLSTLRSCEQMIVNLQQELTADPSRSAHTMNFICDELLKHSSTANARAIESIQQEIESCTMNVSHIMSHAPHSLPSTVAGDGSLAGAGTGTFSGANTSHARLGASIMGGVVVIDETACEVADGLYKAMKGYSTDARAVFDLLERVRSADHWNDVGAVFQTRHGTFHKGVLVRAMHEELTSSEVAECGAILERRGVDIHAPPQLRPQQGSHTTTSTQQQESRFSRVLPTAVVAAAPAAPFDAEAVAEGLFKATKGMDGTDEEGVYALLRTVRGGDDWEAVGRCFARSYSGWHGGDVAAALRGELTSRELARCDEVLAGVGVSVTGRAVAAAATPGYAQAPRPEVEAINVSTAYSGPNASMRSLRTDPTPRAEDLSDVDFVKELHRIVAIHSQRESHSSGPQPGVGGSAPGSMVTHSSVTPLPSAAAAAADGSNTALLGLIDSMLLAVPALNAMLPQSGRPSVSATPSSPPPPRHGVQAPYRSSTAAPGGHAASPQGATATATPQSIATNSPLLAAGTGDALLGGAFAPHPAAAIAERLHTALAVAVVPDDAVLAALAHVQGPSHWMDVRYAFRAAYPHVQGGDVAQALAAGLAPEELAKAEAVLVGKGVADIGAARAASPVKDGRGAQSPPPPLSLPSPSMPAADAPAAIAAVLHHALHGTRGGADADAIHRELARVASVEQWAGVRAAYLAAYPGRRTHDGDVVAALRSQLTHGEYVHCEALLARRSIDLAGSRAAPSHALHDLAASLRERDVHIGALQDDLAASERKVARLVEDNDLLRARVDALRDDGDGAYMDYKRVCGELEGRNRALVDDCDAATEQCRALEREVETLASANEHGARELAMAWRRVRELEEQLRGQPQSPQESPPRPETTGFAAASGDTLPHARSTSPRRAAPRPTAPHAAPIADALHSALMHPRGADCGSVYRSLTQVQDALDWKDVIDAFSAGYPTCHGGDAVATLQRQLAPEEFQHCQSVLRGNGVDMDSVQLNRRGETVIAPATLARNVHHAMTGDTATPPNAEEVCRHLRAVQDPTHFDDVAAAFRSAFPQSHGGDLLSTLRDQLTRDQFQAAAAVLHAKGIATGSAFGAGGIDAAGVADSLHRTMVAPHGAGGAATALRSVRSAADWHAVVAAFSAHHPRSHGGGLARALREELQEQEFLACNSVLRSAGVDLTAPVSPPPPAVPGGNSHSARAGGVAPPILNYQSTHSHSTAPQMDLVGDGQVHRLQAALDESNATCQRLRAAQDELQRDCDRSVREAVDFAQRCRLLERDLAEVRAGDTRGNTREAAVSGYTRLLRARVARLLACVNHLRRTHGFWAVWRRYAELRRLARADPGPGGVPPVRRELFDFNRSFSERTEPSCAGCTAADRELARLQEKLRHAEAHDGPAAAEVECERLIGENSRLIMQLQELEEANMQANNAARAAQVDCDGIARELDASQEKLGTVTSRLGSLTSELQVLKYEKSTLEEQLDARANAALTSPRRRAMRYTRAHRAADTLEVCSRRAAAIRYFWLLWGHRLRRRVKEDVTYALKLLQPIVGFNPPSAVSAALAVQEVVEGLRRGGAGGTNAAVLAAEAQLREKTAELQRADEEVATLRGALAESAAARVAAEAAATTVIPPPTIVSPASLTAALVSPTRSAVGLPEMDMRTLLDGAKASSRSYQLESQELERKLTEQVAHSRRAELEAAALEQSLERQRLETSKVELENQGLRDQLQRQATQLRKAQLDAVSHDDQIAALTLQSRKYQLEIQSREDSLNRAKLDAFSPPGGGGGGNGGGRGAGAAGTAASHTSKPRSRSGSKKFDIGWQSNRLKLLQETMDAAGGVGGGGSGTPAASRGGDAGGASVAAAAHVSRMRQASTPRQAAGLGGLRPLTPRTTPRPYDPPR